MTIKEDKLLKAFQLNVERLLPYSVLNGRKKMPKYKKPSRFKLMLQKKNLEEALKNPLTLEAMKPQIKEDLKKVKAQLDI